MKILYQPWGGLGDNLQFSTLPEQFHKIGIDFYISSQNVYRNQEIYDLVWGMNPYVKGVSDLPPNVGSLSGWVVDQDDSPEHVNRLEMVCGSPISDLPYPKIYYKPNILENFVGRDIVNLSSISVQYSIDQIQHIIKNLPPNTISLSFNIDTVQYTNEFSYKVRDIYEHCDIIHSCKSYTTLHSGGSVLASAIKGDTGTQDVIVYIKEQSRRGFEVDKLYNFSNLTYIFI